MSATQDKSQKTKFVYSNLYQLYRKGKEAAVAAPMPNGMVETVAFSRFEAKNVLKTGTVQVREFEPASLIAKRMPAPAVLPSARQNIRSVPAAAPGVPLPRNAALDSLKQNLKSLNDLHSRLRFMLEELEDLSKE